MAYFWGCFHKSLIDDRIPTNCCNQSKIKKKRDFLFSFSALTGAPTLLDTLLSTVLSPVVPNDTRSTIYFSKDQRKRFDLRVLAEAKSSSPSLSFSLSLISFLPPSSIFSTSVYLLPVFSSFPSTCLESDHSTNL